MNPPKESDAHGHRAPKVMRSFVHLCAASADERIVDELEKHLRALDPKLGECLTREKHIKPGKEIDAARRQLLDQARIIVLLVSADFFASERCQRDMERALEKHKTGTAIVVPVLGRACAWGQQPVASLQILPRDKKPLHDGRIFSDTTLSDVAEELRVLLSDLASRPAVTDVMVAAQNDTGSRHPKYRLIDRLMSGAMGDVSLAESGGIEGFRKLVAIKRISSRFPMKRNFVEMFLDEARLCAQLTHANVVQTFDIGVDDNGYFVVMEYVEGASLRIIMDRLARVSKPFPIEVAVFIASKLCEV